jgi:branched-chain amino acid transport system substrate-binding protein
MRLIARAAWARLVSAAAALTLLGAACGPAAQPSTAPSQPTAPPAARLTTTPAAKEVAGPVRIGAAGPYTGNLANIGSDMLDAQKFAVEEWNNTNGGLFGRDVEVVEGDDQGDPQNAATVAEKFVSDPAIVGVVGPGTSGAVKAALPIYDRANLPIISASATNPDLSMTGAKVFHRVCPTDADQGPAIASFMVQDLKVQGAAMVDDKGTYSVGLADEVERKLKELGIGKIERFSVTPDEKDFSQILTRIKAANFDIVFTPLPNTAQAVAFARQMKQLGVDAKQMGGDGLFDKTEMIDKANGSTEGVYVSFIGPDVKGIPDATAFVDKYRKRFGRDPGTFAAQTYEATTILLGAIQKAGIKNGKIDRQAVNDAVSTTNNYKGILGIPIAFTERGDLKGGTIFIFQVQGKEFKQLKSVNASQ